MLFSDFSLIFFCIAPWTGHTYCHAVEDTTHTVTQRYRYRCRGHRLETGVWAAIGVGVLAW